MAEFASSAGAPAARAVIYSMGFDHDTVQHTLAQAGGNEQLAINFILNGEVHGAVTAFTSAASIAATTVGCSGPASGFGNDFAPSVSFSGPASGLGNPYAPSLSRQKALEFPDCLTSRLVIVVPGGILPSPKQLRAQIKSPLQLMQAAA
jgi:hypothetical protein